MNFVVDIGNTKTKIAWVDADAVKSVKSFDSENFIKNYRQKLKPYALSNSGIISSVIALNDAIVKDLRNNFNCVILDYKTKLPYKNLYKTKKTLGKDRIANIAGAMQLYPQKNVLVIDAGTSITYDFINSTKQYLGGAISPGIRMRFKSLHHFTKGLPLVRPAAQFSEIMGNTTNTSIQSGVINGVHYEILSYIKHLKTQYKNLKIILCGGDASFLADRLKNSIFVSQNLTLLGLNTILKYNRQGN